MEMAEVEMDEDMHLSPLRMSLLPSHVQQRMQLYPPTIMIMQATNVIARVLSICHHLAYLLSWTDIVMVPGIGQGYHYTLSDVRRF